MKHLKVDQKYLTACRIFNFLLGVSSSDETLHLMLDILHERPCTCMKGVPSSTLQGLTVLAVKTVVIEI